MVFVRSFLFPASLLSMSVLVGCGGLLSAMAPKPATAVATNPVQGGELSIARAPRDANLGSSPMSSRPALKPSDCNVWPVEDRYRVRVHDDEICLTLTRSISAGQGVRDPEKDLDPVLDEEKHLLVSDTGASLAMTLQPTPGARKVNSCISGLQSYDVWTKEFSSCSKNTVLTEASRSLTVQLEGPLGRIDEARWTFAGAAPASP